MRARKSVKKQKVPFQTQNDVSMTYVTQCKQVHIFTEKWRRISIMMLKMIRSDALTAPTHLDTVHLHCLQNARKTNAFN